MVSCPVTLDMEIGEFSPRATMVPGYICRTLTEYEAQLELVLRPAAYRPPESTDQPPPPPGPQISSKALLTPTLVRTQLAAQYLTDHPTVHGHAVCAVQTFRNPQSGPMLHLFVQYYLQLGWQVVLFDRFAFHREFLEDLMSQPGFHYHGYTVMQIAQPYKYNASYALAQGFDMKYFYKMEKNWGYVAKRQADTADQDQDKTRTYDYARLEYAHLDALLYVDTDEFFFCPQAGQNTTVQSEYQHALMRRFIQLGIEEMRFVRLPYAGYIRPDLFAARNYTDAQLANHTNRCMDEAFRAGRDPVELFSCWSTASAYDDFPKSADLASRCPFHYNHWSCDGLRGGGRDHTANRCRCKVAFDMMNNMEYKPYPQRCHLLHLNDNKYRFQSRRNKHAYDRGSITAPSPVADMLRGRGEGEAGATALLLSSTSSSSFARHQHAFSHGGRAHGGAHGGGPKNRKPHKVHNS